MRILITGGAGRLGRVLRADLAPLGTVVATRRSDLDVTDAAAVARTVAEIAPDLIVNTTAYTAVDQAETDRDAAWAVNGRAPGYLAGAAAASGAAILHFSTDYVFDGHHDTPYLEDDPTGPINVYGASKLAGEKAVEAAGAPYLVVRTSWLYGADSDNFLTAILRRGARRHELPVVADQVGSPTSVEALSKATATLLHRAADDLAAAFARAHGRLHLSCGGAVSRHSIAEAIVRGAQARGFSLAVRRVRPTTTVEFGGAAPRPVYTALGCDQAAALFGVRLPEWHDALDTVLDEMASARTTVGRTA